MALTDSSVISLVGTIMTGVGTWGLFYLNGIKRSQDNTNKEIKEMNKDIRDVLIQLSKNDEKIFNVSSRLDEVHETIKAIDIRVSSLEKHLIQ